MTAALIGALLAGLLGSPHCAAMCGGFAAACGADGGSVSPWHVGRLLTYATLGALAGAFGAVVPGPSWVATVAAFALLVWFAARLAGLAPETRVRLPWLSRAAAWLVAQRTPWGRVGFGAVTGLLPCGLVYAALAFPVAIGHPAGGALAMVAFWAGTLPALSVAAVGLRKLAATTPWVRRGVALAVLTAGLWSLGLREMALVSGHAAPGEPPACHDAP